MNTGKLMMTNSFPQSDFSVFATTKLISKAAKMILRSSEKFDIVAI